MSLNISLMRACCICARLVTVPVIKLVLPKLVLQNWVLMSIVASLLSLAESSQAALSVEILESVRQQHVAAAAAAGALDPLEAFVAGHHGGDKRAVLQDPALHDQLVELLGVESSALLREMEGIGLDVEAIRDMLGDIKQTADKTLQEVQQLTKGVQQLLAEADPYAFLPPGLTPQLSLFWIHSFHTQQQVGGSVHACGWYQAIEAGLTVAL